MRRRATKIIVAVFTIGLIIGLTVKIYEQTELIETLTNDLRGTQEQLLISNDQLKQIEARNEAIKYIEEAEE